MKLQVVRFQMGSDATNGMLFIDGEFECYTLEDEYRDVKVMGETCIPEGTYNVELRTEGGFHSRYTAKYGDFHKGMLWVKDVPNFEYILIHTGNTDEHTAGCLLLGETSQDLDRGKDGFIGASTVAYKKAYPKILKELQAGKLVTIEYINIKDLFGASETAKRLKKTLSKGLKAL
tara:strand:+ start:159 stop:683 length:525 start_codon:yes stop_codon:yes gene_type:complete